MNLKEQQKLFWKIISSNSNAKSESETASLIDQNYKPSPHLKPNQCIKIYSDMYKKRLTSFICDRFKLAKGILGKEQLTEIASQYIHQNPPRFYKLNQVAKDFQEHLKTNSEPKYLYDIIKFENSIASLNELSQNLAQPGAIVVEFDYDIKILWDLYMVGQEEVDEKIPPPDQKKIYLLILQDNKGRIQHGYISAAHYDYFLRKQQGETNEQIKKNWPNIQKKTQSHIALEQVIKDFTQQGLFS